MTGAWSLCKQILIWTFVFIVFVPALSYSDDAEVLPKGISRFYNDTQFGLPYDQRFNANGQTESLATDFNGNLNSTVFPALQALEIPNPGALGCGLVPAPPYCLAPGTASLGTSVVSFERSYVQSQTTLAYGVTDKLSLGVMIPYLWARNSVNASLDSSTATLGTNAAAVSPANPLGLVPLNAPIAGTQPTTTETAQQILMSLGFDRLQTWNDNGLGDIELGGKYQYYRSEMWRAAFSGGVRLPSGRVDDPDNLADEGFGTGAPAVLFRFHQDFVMQPDTDGKGLAPPGPGGFFINTTLRYDAYLPDTQTLRVCSVHEPLCLNKEKVDRKIGDIFQAEISTSVGILIKGLYFTPMYRFDHKFKDLYMGSQSLNYSALSEETDYSEQIYRLTLTYSTIPLVIEKKFSLPMNVGFYYSERFAGNNNRPFVHAFGFDIALFF